MCQVKQYQKANWRCWFGIIDYRSILAWQIALIGETKSSAFVANDFHHRLAYAANVAECIHGKPFYSKSSIGNRYCCR